MNITDFIEITKTRVPTPREFVNFAYGQGWKFQATPERAIIIAKKSPMVLFFAKLLSREPFRTNVLKYLEAENPQPQAQPEPAREPLDILTCQVCGKDVSDPETRERMADAGFCDQGGSREVVDAYGEVHPASPRCPFKRKWWEK